MGPLCEILLPWRNQVHIAGGFPTGHFELGFGCTWPVVSLQAILEFLVTLSWLICKILIPGQIQVNKPVVSLQAIFEFLFHKSWLIKDRYYPHPTP